MAERDHGDNEDFVIDRVDDAVVTDANPEAGTPLECFGAWRSRILAKKRDRPTNTVAILMVNSLQRSNCGGPQLNLVGHAQPRSAFT